MKKWLWFFSIGLIGFVACEGSQSADRPGAKVEPEPRPQETLTTPEAKTDPEAGLEAKIVQTANGFGYEIYNNGELYIIQLHIPAVEGLQSFESEEDAKRTAEFVIYKLEKGIMPPSLSRKELDSLNVIPYND